MHLHAKITARDPQIDEEGNEVMQRFETTPGRVRWGAVAAERQGAVRLVNRLLRKKEVQQVIERSTVYCGQKEIGHLL